MQKTAGHLRFAHLSDPHFSHLTWDPSQFLSKRWSGNLNLLLNRKNKYQTAHLWHLPELLASLEVDQVFITGDFTSTSLEEEFAEATRFLKAFENQELLTHVLPGNHDCYTKKAEAQKLFYRYFPNQALSKKKLECKKLADGWWYVGLDCTLATLIFQAYGVFSKKLERALEETLSQIPAHDHVIVANHFPLFSSGHPRRDLKRAHELQNVFRAFPQVKLYLHGHDHTSYIVDRQHEGFPLVLNSGSCAHRPDGTLYLVDVTPSDCFVQRLLFRKENDSFSWVIDWQKTYLFNHRPKM